METPTENNIKNLANTLKILNTEEIYHNNFSSDEDDSIDNYTNDNSEENGSDEENVDSNNEEDEEENEDDDEDEEDEEESISKYTDQSGNSNIKLNDLNSHVSNDIDNYINNQIKEQSATYGTNNALEPKQSNYRELDPYELASPKEKKRMKYELLRKLAQTAEENHLVLSENFSLKDDYYDIKREYEYHTGERDKRFFVRKACTWTIQGIGILELISKYYNFLNLDGWKNSMEMNKEELICILSELYEKYSFSSGEQSPEMKLIILLGTTLITTVLSNYGSKLLGSLFGNKKNSTIENIEINATRKALDAHSKLYPNEKYINKNKELFNNLNDEISYNNQLKEQQLKIGKMKEEELKNKLEHEQKIRQQEEENLKQLQQQKLMMQRQQMQQQINNQNNNMFMNNIQAYNNQNTIQKEIKAPTLSDLEISDSEDETSTIPEIVSISLKQPKNKK